MSWSSPLRVLSVCGLWLAIQTGCGGNPSVVNPDTGTSGGTSAGGSDTGNGGRLVIGTGGEGNEGNEGGEGATGPTYVCGNGELEPGEFCEDGNTEDADGCSADCTTVSSEYDCSKVGEPCVQVVICGNGVIEGDEVCDDGNTADDDGCAGDCREVEAGYGCVRPGKACVELSVCGNGVRQRGEQCDDFNEASGDGCDDKCQTEPDYFCITPGEPCKPQVCGNGERTPGEGCDDGNKVSNDGCSADCTSVETGWHCNTMGCKPQCGDGVKVGAEECDDKDAISGDGCSSACKVEPFYQCAGSPSVCSKIPSVCGNGKVEPGELCDTKAAGGANCKPTCNGYIPVVMTSDCKNGVLEAGEECVPDPGKGCDASCKVEPGYTCPQPGVCFLLPKCGDGTVNPGEACDDKNTAVGDGCDATCKVESGYTCVGLGPSVCVKPNCGNGTIEGTEKCDDKNAVNGDGCTACAVDSGFACPTPGAACIAKCGDGVKKPTEACDDGNKVSGDGCNSGCKIEFGYKCPTQGVKCVAAVCGDASNPLDAGEGCDDGNKIAGDGCGPTCQPEPEVTVGPDPVVKVFCGDGLKTGAEACDDGNTTDEDGCESDCTVTPGWQCTAKLTLPTTLDMRVRYRDFKSANALTPGGHPDFQYNTFQQVLGITGAACKSANAAACGRLDADGKPVLVRTNQQNQATGYSTGTGIMSAATFGLWYRDTNPNGVVGYDGAIQIKPITKTLTLTQQGGATSEVYAYSNGDFYPITVAESFKDGGNNNIGNIGAEVAQCDNGNGVRNQVNACGGCDAACKARDYGFTSELRYFFQYKGGERLTFTGDDDVWVYVNGKLAVDLGGLHSQLSGQVVLGDDGNGTAATDSNCSANGVAFADLPDPAGGCYSAAEQSNNLDQRFGLTKGGVYEIVLFHAERHSNASNFRLTLAGFLAPRSSCDTICGDGMVVGDELCDEGVNNSDTASGACTTTCTARNYCGDGVRQLPGEACDNGTNTDIYKTAASAPSVCAPGCKTPASCGDGALQVGQGEQCDKGGLNNDSAYGKNECKTNCKLGGFCGDSLTQSAEGEVCDLGANNGKTYGAGSCGYDCKAGLRCGDGIINGPPDTEQCDDGILNGSIGSHCSAACKVVPFCGDGTKGANEACDWGPFATDNPTEYGGCSSMCGLGPTCGDGTKNGPEECDDGATNNDTVYGGCTKSCALGPRCGDGVKQVEQGEACDNGFNADDYDDPRTAQAECGKNCTPPPFCGDNTVQPAYELCDDGPNNSDTAYEGCTSTCEFGPYCGDGDVSGPETCDDGFDNVAYQAEKGGCSYECQPAPYCGDGERNGSEQCDLGTDENTGDYGGCNADCTFALRCGDQRIDKGEECDDGPTGSLSCTSACKKRPVVVQ